MDVQRKRYRRLTRRGLLGFVWVACAVVTLPARSQSLADASQAYKELIVLRSDTVATKEQVYQKALECNEAFKHILDTSPRGVENYDKAKAVLGSLFPFLKAGAGFYSQLGNDSCATVFAREAVELAMKQEMQDAGLRKDSYYPNLVYFVASRAFNEQDYEHAVRYMREYVDVADPSLHQRVLTFLREAENLLAQQQQGAGQHGRLREDAPDFDIFAREQIERGMTEWKRKDPYETIEEYKERVNEETAKAKQRELQKVLMDEYVQRFAYRMTIADLQMMPYDAENESFLIKSPYGDIVLRVPRKGDEARDFANGWDSVRVYNQQFTIADKKLALASLTFSTPSGKVYVYDNQQALEYNETMVDANFASVDYGMLSNSDQQNKAKIGKKEVFVGVADVDVNIPHTKPTSYPRTFVAIIANEEYTQVPSVPMAGNDGRVFAQYCEQTLGLSKDNILYYPNATYGMMLRAVQDITNIAKAYHDVRIVFYYAGHGIPNESTRDAFLLPVDADGRQTEGCYPLKRLISELSAVEAQSVVVFLDACFSGATADGETLAAMSRGVAIKPRQEELKGNMVIFSAASGDETAYPYTERGHGLFTYYLLKRLQDTKGNTNLGDLAQYVIDNVKQKSVLINRKMQTPVISYSPGMQNSWRKLKLR